MIRSLSSHFTARIVFCIHQRYMINSYTCLTKLEFFHSKNIINEYVIIYFGSLFWMLPTFKREITFGWNCWPYWFVYCVNYSSFTIKTTIVRSSPSHFTAGIYKQINSYTCLTKLKTTTCFQGTVITHFFYSSDLISP